MIDIQSRISPINGYKSIYIADKLHDVIAMWSHNTQLTTLMRPRANNSWMRRCWAAMLAGGSSKNYRYDNRDDGGTYNADIRTRCNKQAYELVLYLPHS